MDDMSAVRRAVDQLLEGDLGPMLDLLAEDVEFEVATGGDAPDCGKEWGKQPVVEYFSALGGLVAFWQMDYTATGEQVIAWGKESFTVEHCEVQGGCEFALVFELSDGMIARFLVVEDLRSFIRAGGSLGEEPPVSRGTEDSTGCRFRRRSFDVQVEAMLPTCHPKEMSSCRTPTPPLRGRPAACAAAAVLSPAVQGRDADRGVRPNTFQSGPVASPWIPS